MRIYAIVCMFMLSLGAWAQQVPLVKPAASTAIPVSLPKPSAAFIAAMSKRAVWYDVKAEAQATLKLADENIAKLEQGMVAEIRTACPPPAQCAFDSSKNEFVDATPKAAK